MVALDVNPNILEVGAEGSGFQGHLDYTVSPK